MFVCWLLILPQWYARNPFLGRGGCTFPCDDSSHSKAPATASTISIACQAVVVGDAVVLVVGDAVVDDVTNNKQQTTAITSNNIHGMPGGSSFLGDVRFV